MKQWRILNNRQNISTLSEVVKIIFDNRHISKDEQKKFLDTNIEDYSIEDIGLAKEDLKKFSSRIDKAIQNKEKIIVFGDYDVDGICATAILWETLYVKSKSVMPYIPGRIDEGYGLSVKGIDNVLKVHPDTALIITVDNGIVAHDAVHYANKKGIDAIVTDHHQKEQKIPQAYCTLHTTSLCGAGIAWFLASYLGFEKKKAIDEKLELACLATVADLVPLVGANRGIVKRGIDILKNTKRIGLIELIREASLDKDSIGVYAIGHIIAPRLNATGRINTAMEGLRLLCTKNVDKAKELATVVSNINKNRQGITEESFEHAKLLAIQADLKRVTVVAHESYNQGVIGLIASQLVESYYKPTFAIAKGEDTSKGSARSIKGVNIIELLRSVRHTLLEVGGHPMAAGFSLETTRIEEFIDAVSKKAETVVSDALLMRTIDIDCELPFSLIGNELMKVLLNFEPFGMGNPEPVFASHKVYVLETRVIGKEKNHLKMKVEQEGKVFDAIAFKMAERLDISTGDTVDIAYTVDENVWNGKRSIQLKIKDIGSN